MTIRLFRNLPCTVLALAGIYMQPILANAQTLQPVSITIAPFAPPAGTSYVIQPSAEVTLSPAQKLKLIQQNIKYVFVLFQENRSFDYYFASYPGAEGLYQHYDGTANTNPPGYNSPIVLPSGAVSTIHPFKIPVSITATNGATVPLYANSLFSVDHSHSGYLKSIDYVNGVAQNDGYALDNEGVTLTNGTPSKTPTLAAEQEAEVAMSHIDCDQAGFLWTYADKFTMFDNFHQTVTGPSTPNAIAMISGQTGETQWVEHPALSSATNTTNFSLPVVADPDPYWGSALDPTPAATKNPEVSDTTSPASNLTFATLPLSFMGNQINSITSQDINPAFDLIDVQADIQKIAGHRQAATNWGWYEEGYNTNDYYPAIPTGTPGAGPNTADGAAGGDYIAHHNAPQYFGYVANNPAEKSHLHGLNDFYTAVSGGTLPTGGGVFYVRGGYNNISGVKPYFGTGSLATQTMSEQVNFAGNDDHPGYSDSQVAETLVAQEVNAIANSPYWSQSAIIISYDETDGEYDHVQPNTRELDPEGNPLAQGPRIPTIVISPYGVSHGVSHVMSEHGSIIRFIDELYNLIPLADLPNEYAARLAGQTMYKQANLGPSDDLDGLGDMTEAFDNNRLTGAAPAIPASYAMIANPTAMPHYNNAGCSVLGITTTDVLQGVTNPLPADFNPRPNTAPGIPASGTWVP